MWAPSFLLTAMILGATGTGQTKEGQAADEDVVRKLGEQYVAAFNKKDPKAVAEIWAEDGDYTSLDGRAAKGRTEIERLFRELLTGVYKDAKTKLITNSVRFPAPDVAVGNATWETTGGRAADGKERPTVRTVSLSVATKRSGQWRVVSALSMVLPAPAAP